ncbi:MAG: hypothetical protein LAQ30_25520 [Acidobacteriia bacterium]|nr:hypothetical protein [Terriglobia bacterium]
MNKGEVRSGDRQQVHRRYPIVLDVEYFLTDDRGLVRPGRGRTVSLSSTGALIQPDQPIPPGAFRVQLAVYWPVRQDKAALTLMIHGYATGRGAGGAISVAFWRHKFTTACV